MGDVPGSRSVGNHCNTQNVATTTAATDNTVANYTCGNNQTHVMFLEIVALFAWNANLRSEEASGERPGGVRNIWKYQQVLMQDRRVWDFSANFEEGPLGHRNPGIRESMIREIKQRDRVGTV